MTSRDLPAVFQLKDAEGWNQTATDLQFILAKNPKHCLVATSGDRIIGSITTMVYQDTLAWIGMMLVDGDFRGQGIATQLLNTSIANLEHCPSIKLDATPLGKDLYMKLGFIPEYELCRMTIDQIPALQGKSPSIEKPKLINTETLRSVINNDELNFGANRGALLTHLFRHGKEHAFVLGVDNTIQGYLFSRPGTRYQQLGPLMAESDTAAKVLLTSAFSTMTSQAIVVDVLADKTELITWLKSLGFVVQRKLLRMYLHENCPGQVHKQYLIAGPELG